MRTYLYRAWHKQEQRMYYVGGFHHILEADYQEPERQFEPDIQEVYLLDEEPRTCQKVWTCPASDVELMEWTGLLDIHHTKVWDSDILRSYEGILWKVQWNDEKAEFELAWHGGPQPVYYRAGLYLIKDTRCAVIGNIHENPQLLSEPSTES